MLKFSIPVQENTVQLQGDYMSDSTTKNTVVCLHGGGATGRSQFNILRGLLLEKSISSFSFDFSGHGETGGEMSASSLHQRVKEATIVIENQKITQPLSILASSMSGYVAIKLTEMFQIENLILLAPAVYDARAYEVLFGPDFSSIIRKPGSWIESDAWKILEKYTGNLLVVKAESDDVIPEEVIERTFNSAQNAKSREIITIPNATHPLLPWLDGHASEMKQIIEKICYVINEK